MNAFAEYQKIALTGRSAANETVAPVDARRSHRPVAVIQAELDAVPSWCAPVGFAGLLASGFLFLGVGVLIGFLPVKMLAMALVNSFGNPVQTVLLAIASGISALAISWIICKLFEGPIRTHIADPSISMLEMKNTLRKELAWSAAHETMSANYVHPSSTTRKVIA